MLERVRALSPRHLAVLLPAFVATFAHGGAAAQGDALDEIVVTATRMQAPVREVPRSISIVGEDRIQNATQQLGLDEALAVVPGLYMQNRYNFSQDLRISLRGFGARSSFGIRGILPRKRGRMPGAGGPYRRPVRPRGERVGVAFVLETSSRIVP